MVLPERLLNDKAHARLNMVNCQLRPNGIVNTHLIRAFESVPMEIFLPPPLQPLAYSDADLPLTLEPGPSQRWLLAPLTLGKLLQCAHIQPTDKVLIVGCGSGYSLTLISQLAKQVIGLESDDDLTHTARTYGIEENVCQVHIVLGALSIGYPKEAPYDVILIEGAVEHILPILIQQLALHGRLVTVITEQGAPNQRGMGKGIVITRNEDTLTQEVKFDASCPPLPEFDSLMGFQL